MAADDQHPEPDLFRAYVRHEHPAKALMRIGIKVDARAGSPSPLAARTRAAR